MKAKQKVGGFAGLFEYNFSAPYAEGSGPFLHVLLRMVKICR